MYVKEFFSLDNIDELMCLTPVFGYDGFGEIVFYRTYSRIKSDGGQETWHDVVIRIINGTMSIRKDWYVRNGVEWDETYWQLYALRMAISLFKMHWMPAGRGMWAMGTEFIYTRGAMALNNCGATKLGSNDRLSDDFHWMMDALMLGVGVGFEPIRDELKIYKPIGSFLHFVGDSREGWCDSLKMLVDAYIKPGRRKPNFDYSLVRPKGAPINGFGGLASGPEPLALLFKQVETLFESPGIDIVRLKTDIANMIGCCVVAGNVRRSAELAMGSVKDNVFMDLKDWDRYPEREDYGGMSNNTVRLFTDDEFMSLGEVAKRVVIRGEPGVANHRNFKKGRVGKKKVPVREDAADLLNPCGEIPLEDKELCNVVETCPTVCPSVEAWYNACEYATFYASTVSLLPTHRAETNRVVVRNRRIGVGIIDWTGWVHSQGLHRVTAFMRKGYDIVTSVNRRSNETAGVPESIRKTTIKPGGTGPKLPGKTPGIGNPTFDYTLRRMRAAANNPICPVLDASGVPFEPDFFDPVNTRVYEYPTLQGPAQPAEKVSLWEQAMNLVTVQREWSDNAVSNTLYFKPMWKLVLSRDTFVRDWSDPNMVPVERWRQFTEEFPAEMKALYGGPSDHVFDQIFSKPKEMKSEALLEEYNWGSAHVRFNTKMNKYGEWELRVYEFDPNHEEGIIEKVLSAIVPLIKSCSLLPHTAKGAYRQMPEEGITKEEYEKRLGSISKIDWTQFRGSDGIDEKYCTGPVCEIPGR